MVGRRGNYSCKYVRGYRDSLQTVSSLHVGSGTRWDRAISRLHAAPHIDLIEFLDQEFLDVVALSELRPVGVQALIGYIIESLSVMGAAFAG